jgi:serine phosphatase RsbU (regulator of sigma subunit)
MSPRRTSGKHAVRIAAALLLLLAALPAKAEFWEAPESLGEGRYPSFFSAEGGPVLVWQESRSSGESGKAWIRFARYSGGEWRAGSVSDSAYAYNSAGTPPILYSAAQSRNGTIAVAIAASATSIEIRLLRDGEAGFERVGTLESSAAVVAPRIYPSASGGWLVFAGQGRPSASVAGSASPAGASGAADQAPSEAIALPSSVSIYVARSAEGREWSGFEPLVSESEQLLVNFAPFSEPLGGKDIVVFQTFILGEGDLRSRSALMSKTSADGGATWTKARAITDFADPAGGPEAAAQNFDNQGAQLGLSGGKLWVAWERRRTKATQVQVWAARIDESGALDPRTAGQAVIASGSFKLSEFIDSGGFPVILALEEKLKANRVLISSFKDGRWSSEDADLAGRSDPGGAGLVNFAREAEAQGRTFVAWQIDSGGKGRILAMTPDVKAAAPSLVPLNFTAGKRARPDAAQVRVGLPVDASGVKTFAYVWKKTPDGAGEPALAKFAPSLDELWRNGVRKGPDEAGLSLPASQDGSWTLWASIEDNAGNRSPLAALSYYRKRIPPAPPIVMPPDTDERGFLSSNSFTLRWIPPEADDIAGYSWDLALAGPLEQGGSAATQASFRAAAGNPPQATLPGLSPYESSLVRSLGLRIPPPGIRGSATSYTADNVDDGYYVFSVSAVDTTGNISGAASILVKADKYRPYTTIALAEPRRDDLGRTILRILGRGYLAGGRIERIVIDRNGREPYDIDRALAKGDYRVASDREIAGLTFETDQAGSYRIGLYHSARGWYWTAPIIAIDTAGTVKYGLNPDWAPAFRLFPGRSHPFTIYDAMVLMAIAFAAVGILLSSRQVLAVAREGELVRREAIALITGGPMPQARTGKAARELARRGAGLRVKFTLTIAFLVILVVLMLAVILGYSMIVRTSSDLATGLDQRARVLLESVAQGSRYWMGKEEAVTQLGLFPSQTKAMQGAANYITITGEGSDPKVASGEIVYATNDGKITAKLDPATLTAGAYALGKSAFKAEGGSDPLAPLMAAKVGELRDKAASAVSDELQIKSRLAQEKAGLKPGSAGDQRRGEINAELDASDRRIRDKLSALSDQEMDSLPRFDAASLAAEPGVFLYFKPILEYRPSDSALYRGMVRLEVSTAQIVAEVRAATFDLVRLTLIIAAIALGIGLIGAFILSTIIVVPIRKLVAQIERIRDTVDIESLEGSKIEVKSHDELFTLAETINQMTEGLVKAAKDSKELIVGKGIQKMFIPLDAAPGSRVKLSTGRRDEKEFEIFGYYEGAKGVSGDYWDFKSINSRYHYFIKCDISGKGVSAALIMVQVATMVINYFNEWKKAMPKTIDLTDLTYKINDFLEERQFVGRFAAFTLGVWDSIEGVAYLCEAGDRKLHVWEEAARRMVEEILPDSPAAGPLASFMVQMKKPFVQVTRRLGHGDALMLYTDGIEEAKRRFRDKDYKVIECADAEKDQPHENHTGGQDNEEFGYERITGVLEAVASRSSYRLEKHHNPAPGEILSFDFSACGGGLEEKIIALISVEKVFRLYRDPSATAKEAVLVDKKIDEFLEKHFDQYRLYCSDKRPNVDNENPGYLLYHGIREDAQYDDLTLLAIRRK